MKKFVFISLASFFSMHTLMAATITSATFDPEKQEVKLDISYCFGYESQTPTVAMIPGYCLEIYPPICFIDVIVDGENANGPNCNIQTTTYPVSANEIPAHLTFFI